MAVHESITPRRHLEEVLKGQKKNLASVSQSKQDAGLE
jgi:hypothetical protein